MGDTPGGPRSSNVIGVGNLPRGQTYGTGVQQQAALSAVPLSPSGPSGSPSGPSNRSVPAGLQPGQIPSLSDPSARPDEPVTAGLPIGPGAGPDALGTIPQAPEEVSVLRLLLQKYKNEDIRRLLEYTESSL